METAIPGYLQTTYDMIMSGFATSYFCHGTTYRWKVEDLE